jgi:hypothetical protein
MTGNGFVRGVLVLVAASGVFAATAGAADEKEVVGTWKLSYNPGDGPHESTLTVTKEGAGLKGTFVDGDKKHEVKGVKYQGGKLTVSTRTEHEGEPATATFEGEVKADAIDGEGRWEYQGMTGSFPFQGKREAAKPKG